MGKLGFSLHPIKRGLCFSFAMTSSLFFTWINEKPNCTDKNTSQETLDEMDWNCSPIVRLGIWGVFILAKSIDTDKSMALAYGFWNPLVLLPRKTWTRTDKLWLHGAKNWKITQIISQVYFQNNGKKTARCQHNSTATNFCPNKQLTLIVLKNEKEINCCLHDTIEFIFAMCLISYMLLGTTLVKPRGTITH